MCDEEDAQGVRVYRLNGREPQLLPSPHASAWLFADDGLHYAVAADCSEPKDNVYCVMGDAKPREIKVPEFSSRSLRHGDRLFIVRTDASYLLDSHGDSCSITTRRRQGSGGRTCWAIRSWASPATARFLWDRWRTCGQPAPGQAAWQDQSTYSVQASGGQGAFTNAHFVGAGGGRVTFYHDAYSIPDAFDVSVGGELRFSTGGLVSDSNTAILTIDERGVVFVSVSAPEHGTSWEYSLSCVGDGVEVPEEVFVGARTTSPRRSMAADSDGWCPAADGASSPAGWTKPLQGPFTPLRVRRDSIRPSSHDISEVTPAEIE